MMEALAQELKSDTCKKTRKVSLSLGEFGLDVLGEGNSYNLVTIQVPHRIC